MCLYSESVRASDRRRQKAEQNFQIIHKVKQKIMFRITHCMVTARSLLYRRTAIECQLASISRSHPLLKYKDPTERETCPVPPPPPPPPPKDDKLLWGTIMLLFLTGGFAVYAHESPETRDWLSINAPWFDDLIAVIYQENVPIKESLQKFANDTSKAFIKYMTEDPNVQKDCEPPPVVARPDPVCRDPDDSQLAKGSKPKICKEKQGEIIVTKTICEIEFCIKDASEAILNNYITARDASIYYNNLIMEIMKDFTMAGLNSIEDAKQERIKLVKDSLANVCESNSALDELVRYLDCGVKAPKEHIESTKLMLAEFRNKIEMVHIEYQWANDLSTVIDVQVQKVMDTIMKYTEANSLMFANLNYNVNRPQLKGDADLLIYQTLRFLEKLKVELYEAVDQMTDRVNRALEIFPNSEKQLKDANALYSKKKGEVDKEYCSRTEAQKQANDKLLKQLLKKQQEKHEEILQIRLRDKEAEATVKLNKMVADKVAAEKKNFALQLREMATKLKFVEDKLEARLKAEREARRSQELWSAGASLLAATKKGDPYVNVDKEIRAIEKAVGDGDKLVLTVLKAIPDSVREKGLVPESVLREKYHSMEKVAMSVALVEEEGAPLPVYFLSWIQSWLLFMKLSGIPQKEFDNPPKEPPKEMDTFDLLHRARFYVERGNLALALRYVNSLEGASRGAAASWTEAARSHLETRQAAEAVIAHAVALGLQYI